MGPLQPAVRYVSTRELVVVELLLVLLQLLSFPPLADPGAYSNDHRPTPGYNSTVAGSLRGASQLDLTKEPGAFVRNSSQNRMSAVARLLAEALRQPFLVLALQASERRQGP